MEQRVELLAEQYDALVAEQKLIEERVQELKKRLIEILKTQGAEDDKGSLHVFINSADTAINEIVYQRRVSKPLDMNAAEEVLASKNLMERCLTMKPVLDEQEIMAAYAEDLLDDSDIDTMFPAKETWAFVTKRDK